MRDTRYCDMNIEGHRLSRKSDSVTGESFGYIVRGSCIHYFCCSLECSIDGLETPADVDLVSSPDCLLQHWSRRTISADLLRSLQEDE
jgi:hypothetical protein